MEETDATQECDIRLALESPGPSPESLPPDRLEIPGASQRHICLDAPLVMPAACGDFFVPPDAVGAIVSSAKT